MKILGASQRLRPRQRGVALVLVLAFLVIILGLAVAFLSRAGLERSASAGYAAASSTRQLADLAVNLVQGQIRDATTQGAAVAWASQPGMVRTFDTAGTLKQAYKLYSADSLISSSVNLTADLPPAAWAADLSVWTDLNAPVSAGGVDNYPILDPSTLSLLAAQRVQGFSLTSPPITGTTNPAPMPVKWLYVLKDGSLEAPTGTGRTATIAGASADNPIVGRVAFWTDDETCKVNVNTAGEGIYWDTPRANTSQEILFADRQPVNKEFQRYPGHPAMTSLSAVFPGLTPDQIYGIVPRLNGGGSNAGTARTTTSTPAIKLDSDRLYASVDELIFSAISRGANTAGLTKTQLEQAKFFISTTSRAPEVNLFNLPRIACWPIYKNLAPNYATVFDKLIAFCSTINGHPYYFQRENANSSSNDIGLTRNGELYAYLQNLTARPVPGFGGDTFSGKYPAGDRDQILTEIFDYIRSTNLADDNLDPSKRFTKPPGPGAAWVVPTISGNTMGFGRAYTLSSLSIGFICNADGTGFLINGAKPDPGNAPVKASNDAKIDSNNTTTNKLLGGTLLKGEPFYDVGYSIAGVPVAGSAGNNVFDWDDTNGNGKCDFEPWDDASENGLYDAAESYVDGNGNGKYDQEWHEPLHDWGRDNNFITLDLDGSQGGPANAGVRRGNGVYDPGEKYIQAIIVPELFSVMQGWVRMGPDMQVEITGLESLTVTVDGVTQNLFPPAASTSVPFNAFPGNYWDMRGWGAFPAWRYFATAKGSPARGNLSADAATGLVTGLYPFIGNPIKIRDTAGSMIFSGGNVTVKFYAGASAPLNATTLIQTFKLNFPGETFPTPNIVSTGTPGTPPVVTPPFTNDPYGSTKPENWWAFSWKGIADDGTIPGRLGNLYGPSTAKGMFFRKEFDVVRSILPRHGDFRVIAATRDLADIGNVVFVAHPSYDDQTVRMAHSFGGIDRGGSGGDFAGTYIAALAYPTGTAPVIASNAGPADRPEATGDYDAGSAKVADGAYINKPDEGNAYRAVPTNIPYFDSDYAYVSGGTMFFTPNRIMPSPGMFGSLSAGIKTSWRTLLFRPQPGHPSAAVLPRDHLLMDLFWMPVVEPYAISDPFSTAGKVNLNYQMLPFTYIERSTGLQAILKSEKVGSIPNSSIATYKVGAGGSIFRLDVNIPETLKQFSTKFSAGQIFKSASEICDIDIVPSDGTAATMSTYWNTRQLTGDNLRERIYTTIYPRLTTKSNTFTVHYKVQALKKASKSQTIWSEDKDKVVGEYRGSTTIERYINPNDPNIPDYGKDPNAIPELGSYYKWRVLNTRQFAP